MSKATGTSSLVHVVGISSSATAARMKPTNLLTANLFNGQMVDYFNLWDYKAAKMAFADGGNPFLNSGTFAQDAVRCCKQLRYRSSPQLMPTRPTGWLCCSAQPWCLLLPLLPPAPVGVVDPLGLMPLLRRGVKNIIACVATRTEPTLSMQEFAIGKPQLSSPSCSL